MTNRLLNMNPQERQRLEFQVEKECRRLKLAIRRLIARWKVRRQPYILGRVWNGIRLLFGWLLRNLGLKQREHT
jgi:hypothetical protein